MQLTDPTYGKSDASFQAAGGVEGIRRLVDSFYDIMDSLQSANEIRAMHPEDLTLSRTKLTYFLCGWMGGPRLYAQHYGPIDIPRAHQHLMIDHAARDAWLQCMQLAIEQQPFAAAFKTYLLEQLAIPAEKIRQFSCAAQAQSG